MAAQASSTEGKGTGNYPPRGNRDYLSSFSHGLAIEVLFKNFLSLFPCLSASHAISPTTGAMQLRDTIL